MLQSTTNSIIKPYVFSYSSIERTSDKALSSIWLLNESVGSRVHQIPVYWFGPLPPGLPTLDFSGLVNIIRCTDTHWNCLHVEKEYVAYPKTDAALGNSSSCTTISICSESLRASPNHVTQGVLSNRCFGRLAMLWVGVNIFFGKQSMSDSTIRRAPFS